MERVNIRQIVSVICLCLVAAISVSAQDFQRNYGLGAGGTVSIKNISGNVTLTGYNGSQIIVTAYKEGVDKDKVTIEDSSDASSVRVRTKYPENCRCNVSVRFEVQVPSEVNYKFNSISSVSGNVSVTGVMGDLTAKSVSGEVSVDSVTGKANATSVSGNVKVGSIAGTVSAKSTSGNVNVEIRRLSGSENMEFASVSGNVYVKLPGNLDANVKMSTLSGNLQTDFPINIEESRYGPGRRASGQVGAGARSLKISTISGDIRLNRS